jgi:hypothetical protein
VIVIVTESLSYSQVAGSLNAPFQTSLASQCTAAPDYFGLTCTSATNYLGISAGQYPFNAPGGCGSLKVGLNSDRNFHNQVTAAGLSGAGSWGPCHRRALPRAG